MTKDSVFKYQWAFHDGSVKAIKHTYHGSEIWMNSASIAPSKLKDDIPLSNFGTINGKLHIEGIQSITKDDVAIAQLTMEDYHDGEIFDFEIHGNEIELNIDWYKYNPHVNTGMVSYRIHADKIYWENIPDLATADEFLIENYVTYFLNSLIRRLDYEPQDGAIALAMESSAIPPSKLPSNEYTLTAENTLKGVLELRYLQGASFNGKPIDYKDLALESATILQFEIGSHIVKLQIKHAEEIDNVEIKAGSIEWRGDYTKPSK